MATDRKCLACDHLRDRCTGRSTACHEFKRLDFERDALDVSSSKEVLPKSSGEGLTQRFDRIGAKRQQQALEAIRKLEHLTSRYLRKRTGVTTYTYEWTTRQAFNLIQPIEAAIEKLKSELMGCDTPREHGLIEESSGVPMNEIG